MLTLADVFEAITGTAVLSTLIPEVVINEAAVDSRQIIPGAMFIALPGERTDGHNYLHDAFKNGATLALIQQDLPAPAPLYSAAPSGPAVPSGRFPRFGEQAGAKIEAEVGAAPPAPQPFDGQRARSAAHV